MVELPVVSCRLPVTGGQGVVVSGQEKRVQGSDIDFCLLTSAYCLLLLPTFLVESREGLLLFGFVEVGGGGGVDGFCANALAFAQAGDGGDDDVVVFG